MKYLSIVLLLSGCNSAYISNEEYIKNVKLCSDSGLDYREIRDGWSSKTTDVVCAKPINHNPS